MTKLKKILLLKGQSQYNVLRYWTDELAKGFEKCNIECVLFDLEYSNSINIPSDINAIIGYNGCLLESGLFKDLDIPYIYLLADHPIDHLSRLDYLQEKDILTVWDRNDAITLKQLGYNFSNVYMLSMGAMEITPAIYEKEIDVLFTGSFSDELYYMQELEKICGGTLKNICNSIINLCLKDESQYYLTEFINAFQSMGIIINKNQNTELLKTARLIGLYIYSTRRNKIIKEIANSGINISIYGNGWENSELFNHPNINFNNAVNSWIAIDLMKISRVVLDIQGLLVDGVTERTLSGMASGAVTATHITKYVDELFGRKGIIPYTYNNIATLVDNIRFVIDNTQTAEKIYIEGRNLILEGRHTIADKAKTIIQIYDEVYDGS